MWIYEQRTGRLYREGDPENYFLGYAGAGVGKNNPSLQHVEDVGPLPRGDYDIMPPQDTVTHGPFVLRLVPHDGNEMHGRDGFMMHGDSKVHPGTASEGCIIQSKSARDAVWRSENHQLRVI